MHCMIETQAELLAFLEMPTLFSQDRLSVCWCQLSVCKGGRMACCVYLLYCRAGAVGTLCCRFQVLVNPRLQCNCLYRLSME